MLTCCVQEFYQQQLAGPPPLAYAGRHVPGPRLPYVAYNVLPRPNFQGPVSMYAHPPSPVLSSPSPPSTWRQAYIPQPQQLPALNQPPPLHVSYAKTCP